MTAAKPSSPPRRWNKNSQILCVCVEWGGDSYTLRAVCGRAGDALMADKKLAFKALIAPLSEIPLKVSFPSNYVLRFISAFRQTASEAFGGGEKKTRKKEKTLCSITLFLYRG